MNHLHSCMLLIQFTFPKFIHLWWICLKAMNDVFWEPHCSTISMRLLEGFW
ncbi:hypothetical protein ES332_D02G211900v1 [Gossypium tomentosum]|uniref:Uncharacterized protein n=1 Tax=Gossypium tomentosum TaxID=34277 RepID=A0A5D2LZY3_GOSTO|nr:hypothetical protein ES332_D02G211900v1 [Gossypium tomentosum]